MIVSTQSKQDKASQCFLKKKSNFSHGKIKLAGDSKFDVSVRCYQRCKKKTTKTRVAHTNFVRNKIARCSTQSKMFRFVRSRCYRRKGFFFFSFSLITLRYLSGTELLFLLSLSLYTHDDLCLDALN